MDPLEAVLDEVALEGLDGISLQTLWTRLEKRQPAFGLNLDPLTQQFLWTCLSRTAEVRFYLLPEDRRPVKLFNRFEEIERGVNPRVYDPLQDPYAIGVVTDDPEGIQGSCAFYKEREDVTGQIRTPQLTTLMKLEQIQNQWGERLVLVACQELRYRALIGPSGNSEVKLTDITYCILERVGRARWQGELQRELHTHIFRMDAGKLHYLRRSLDRNNLITLQSHVSVLPSGTQQHSLLLVLKRFCVDRRSKYDLLMESASKFLSTQDNHICAMSQIKKHLVVGQQVFKRLYQCMVAEKMVSVVKIPHQQLNPDEVFKTNRKAQASVRCLKLLRPYGQVEEEEEDDEEEESKQLAEPRVIERDFLTQAHNIVVASGTQGISQKQLGNRLNVGRLEGRMLCRMLERMDQVKGFMEDVGRQRITKYVSWSFVNQSHLNLNFAKEKQRSQHLRDLPQKTPAGKIKVSAPETKAEFSKAHLIVEEEPPVRSPDQAPDSHSSQSEILQSTAPVVKEVLTEVNAKVELHETYRLLKRKNLIIEAVRSSRIIEGVYTLHKLLIDEEKKDGVNTRVCKKSVLRLVRSLSREKLLKLYSTVIIQDGIRKQVEFVVDPSVSADDALVKSAINQIRLRMSSSTSAARESQVKQKEGKSPGNRSNQKRLKEKMNITTTNDFKPVLVPGQGRAMGFQPKMPRLRVVQSFLWHVIYGHPLGRSDTEASEEEHRVYVEDCHWRRFVPPVPLHKEYGEGWALVSDMLLSMPLSIFIQVVQINYNVEGLDQFLNDPLKRHYLISFLPFDIKRKLLNRRKYIFSFSECLQRLCLMGLLQFGPNEKFTEKEQVFVFLKRHATVTDTTACEPHYNLAVEKGRVFERRHYNFSSVEDVDNYWFHLMCVCINTPLGVVRYRTGASDVAESEQVLPMERCPRLQHVLQGRREVVDDGETPGDGQGAGGLDSVFFSHLNRNWMWTSHRNNTNTQNSDAGRKHTIRLRNLVHKHTLRAPPSVIQETVLVSSQPASRNEEVRGGRKLPRKRQKQEVKVVPRKRKRALPVRNSARLQDETDRKALLEMTKQRVTWTHTEDSLLMLCRVASHFLNRKLKRPFVPWAVVRDVLHAEFEFSRDKTSLSVSRRSRYIMKNPQTSLNYRICVAEIYQDTELTTRFQNRTADYNDAVVCALEYKEFVSALRSKFSSSYESSDIIIPDTQEELFKKFKVYRIGDDSLPLCKDNLKSVQDIHYLVLFNLIQSTLVLTNSQMKKHNPYQSYCQYTQFNEDVLSQVFQSCRSRGLVNRRRNPRLIESSILPFLPMSYQLSQHYYRFFSWRFPSRLSDEVHDLMLRLYSGGSSDGNSSFCFQSEGESEVVEKTGELQMQMDAPGGSCACCLTLMTLGLMSVHLNIPQQIVMVDTSSVDTETVKSLTQALEEDEDEEEKKRSEIKPHQASHTQYLLMRGFYSPTVLRSQIHNSSCSDNIVVNTCTVHMQLRHTPRNTLFSSKEDLVSSLSPLTAPALPRWFTRVYHSSAVSVPNWGERFGPSDERVFREIMEAVLKGAEFGVDRQELCLLFSHLENVDEGRSLTLQQYLQELVDGEMLVEVGSRSQRLVCVDVASHWLVESPKANAKMQQACLKRSHSPEPTLGSDRPLKRRATESEVLNPTNTPDSHTVAMESSAEEAGHVQASDVPDEKKAELQDDHSFSQKQDAADKNTFCGTAHVRFVSRPWRAVDGSINAVVCKGMLESLVQHVMMRPAIRQTQLLQHYGTVLQHTAILELLQLLVDIGCLSRRFVVQHDKPSLFSKPRVPEVKGQTEVSVKDTATVFYVPTVECTQRLAQVFPGQPSWNRWVKQCPQDR